MLPPVRARRGRQITRPCYGRANRLFRFIITVMDSSDEDGDNNNGVFAISEDFVESRQHKVAGVSSVDFDGLLQTPLRLHEDLKEGCGGQLWPAGMVLSKYMLRRHKTDLEGRSM